MPFKSEAQRRFMYAAEARGEVPKGTAAKWQEETGKKKLPEKKAAYAAGLHDALDKVAARRKGMTGEERENRAYAGAGIGFAGGTASAATIGTAAARGLVETVQPSDIHLSDAMTKTLKRDMGVPDVKHEWLKNWRHSHYELGGGVARAPRRGGEFMAHELGHAASDKSKIWHTLNVTGRSLGPIVGMAGGGAMALAGDRGSTATRVAPLVTAAGWAPTLIDEGVASVRAYRGLKKMKKVNPQALKKARNNLIKAFGTYGSVAAATTLPVALISAYRWKKPEGAPDKGKKGPRS
jgi:hypothetical protein